MTDDPGARSASNRHRPDELGSASAGGGVRAPSGAGARAPGAARQARGAIIALGVAAIGTVAFVVGLRAALHKIPPERPAAATADTAADSARGRRFRPPAPNQPDEYPRLR